jgi:small membrane protein
MLASQIILSIIIIFFILKITINFFVKKNISSKFFIFWLFLWFLGLLFINFTPLLSFLAKKLGIGRGVDLAVYTSIILIFYFLYLINVEIYELKKRIEKLVRELALKNKIKD